jgi:hypothetical protein
VEFYSGCWAFHCQLLYCLRYFGADDAAPWYQQLRWVYRVRLPIHIAAIRADIVFRCLGQRQSSPGVCAGRKCQNLVRTLPPAQTPCHDAGLQLNTAPAA